VRQVEAQAMNSIITPTAIRSTQPNTVAMSSAKKTEAEVRRMTAQTVEKMDITNEANTKQLFPLRAPPMATPPDTAKKTKVKILMTNPIKSPQPAMPEPRAMKPQIMWITPSAVAALMLYPIL